MLTKTINKLPKSQIEVIIILPWADLEPKWNSVLQKLAQEVELPGFRKGQAPLPMVEQSLGTKLSEQIFKEVMPQSLIEALQGTNIIPIDYPKYQLVSFSKGGQLQFKALLTEKPAVEIGEYKNIKAARPSLKTVTDEDVNKLVNELFKKWKAKPSFVKTSEDKQPSLTGAVGNSGSMSFNQPSGLVNAAGEPLSTQTIDTPNDDFAKAVGAQSLTDLRNKIKTDLEAEAKNNNELDFEEAILQEVEKITKVELPDILVEDELNRMLVSLQRRVAEMGVLLDDYLKGQNKTLEGIKAEWRAQAEKNVRMELGLAEIARREGVQITDEEVQKEVDKIPDAKIKAQFEAQEPRLHLKHSLRQIRTLDFLKSLVKAL